MSLKGNSSNSKCIIFFKVIINIMKIANNRKGRKNIFGNKIAEV